MNREALRTAAQEAHEIVGAAPRRASVRGAWLIRAAVVVYLVVAGIVTYAVLFTA